jgi:hypothetical protein
MTNDEISIIAKYFKENIKNISPLGNGYFYNHLPLCIIDAVWSIGVRYEGVQNVIMRYYINRKIVPYREESLRKSFQYPDIKNQESLTIFLQYLKNFSYEQLSDKVFKNKQRTSTKNGILKSEAVMKFTEVLLKYNVNYFQDIETKIKDNKLFELDIKNIPGQKSGICLEYFFMLSGDENKIKPDRMIKRFLATPLKNMFEEDISINEAQDGNATVTVTKFPVQG